ncbi:hypothetical protein [Fusobacterium animalis]|uniref:hypothetical protein n=1 Tax=Fusobacterium animalis TaxID=76859 RepID=UPI0030D4BCA8
MEKEKVLEIEITKINDDWSAITVKKIKKDFGNNDLFEWINIGGNYLYNRKIFINRIYPHIPFLIRNEIIEHLKDIVNAINEKYGIPKRWRAEYRRQYLTILSNGEIEKIGEYEDIDSNLRYSLGNYFKTEEEAQKVIDSKEWQEFWAKVRAGEIGEEAADWEEEDEKD